MSPLLCDRWFRIQLLGQLSSVNDQAGVRKQVPGGLIKGWYRPDTLDTYDSERRAAAEYLINLDKTFSATASGRLPKSYRGSATDPNELYYQTFSETVMFNIGLGIHYSRNILNREPAATALVAGWRGSDCLVQGPGSSLPVRLFQLTKNKGPFWMITFAGQPSVTKPKLLNLRKYCDSKDSFTWQIPPNSVGLLTIVSGQFSQPDMTLGVAPFGKVYYDIDGSAHAAYGISTDAGALVALRPDGIFGYASTLDKADVVGRYFLDIFNHKRV